MMAPYPFFGFPMSRRPYPYYSVHNPVSNSIKSAENHYFPNGSNHHEKNFSNPSSTCSTNKNSQSSSSLSMKGEEQKTEECFEIFGIKLYFDDLLLIALLFFLYQEEVKDTYLYIALILLLLS